MKKWTMINGLILFAVVSLGLLGLQWVWRANHNFTVALGH